MCTENSDLRLIISRSLLGQSIKIWEHQYNVQALSTLAEEIMALVEGRNSDELALGRGTFAQCNWHVPDALYCANTCTVGDYDRVKLAN